MIMIVDYGMGNLGSIQNMFKRIGIKAQIESDPSVLRSARKIVLPGVGSFDAAMQRINEVEGLRETLDRKACLEKVPVLGVCLGMQLLTDSSEEGVLPGLGWIAGKTIRFPSAMNLKIPHMGWNNGTFPDDKPTNLILKNLPADSRFYFVHSYFVKVNNDENAILKTSYGIKFDAAIAKDNIFGVQFHPEKSHKFGMQIFQNFVDI
jgi:imidazole glycerol-phosphate synthase subunit HisH